MRLGALRVCNVWLCDLPNESETTHRHDPIAYNGDLPLNQRHLPVCCLKTDKPQLELQRMDPIVPETKVLAIASHVST